MLTVYEASAGSGKTFQLVLRYLNYLIKNPTEYRNILAVTFTNKAANEMKERILEQLHLLARGEATPYRAALKDSGDYSDEYIKSQAQASLENILYDYGRFSVGTIDSFVQRILKAFNREIGITPNFTLELDDNRVLKEATDKMLDKLGEDKKLKEWLILFGKEKISEGKSYNITEDILNLGRELSTEKFQLLFSEVLEKRGIFTKDDVEKLGRELNKIKAAFEAYLIKKAKECLSIIISNGFSINDFSYGKSGVAGFLDNLANGIIKEPGSRALGAGDSSENWVKRVHESRDSLIILVEIQLLPRLLEIIDYYYNNLTDYYSAIEVSKNLRVLGILVDLKNEIRSIMVEQGGLKISDSGQLLNSIIGNSDTPFIYEKSGVRYKHFLLDEFQDTSIMQWSNFKPLILNSLAEGNSSLIVGDVKQAIYRWRNSDWTILGSRVFKEISAEQIVKIPLLKNWRSRKEIITFNGCLFETFKDLFQEYISLSDINVQASVRFAEPYENLVQEFASTDEEMTGLVEFNFLDEETFEDEIYRLIVDQVKYLQDHGMSASDIAILIRKNSEGEKVIEKFLEESSKAKNRQYNLNILSNESLFLKSSKGVHFVILVFECILKEDPVIEKVALLHLWNRWLKAGSEKRDIDESGEGESYLYDAGGMDSFETGSEFEKSFEAGPGRLLKEIKPRLLQSSLDEAIPEICSCFDLFSFSSELPFLQALIDKAAELKMNLSNDISSFLYWWYDKGVEESVSVNDDLDAVRIMTIHKAKGLEFEAVIIPFLNWNTTSWTGNQAPFLWCESHFKPYNLLPMVPVRAGGKLMDTIFKDEYIDEMLNSYIDTMNLIYVAFTRAKSVLFVTSVKPDDENKNRRTRRVNSLLYSSLEQMSTESLFVGCWNSEKEIFRYGDVPVLDSTPRTSSAQWIDKYHFYDIKKRLSLRINSEDFLTLDDGAKSMKNYGKVIHEILSEVVVKSDLIPACQKAYMERKIDEKEREYIVNKLNTLFDDPLIGGWFDGRYRVLNERTLISRKGVFRPDRVMILEKSAVVVDYKWGFVKSESYYYQVTRYVELLKQAGYDHVDGYLWYINLDEVIKIN